MEDRKENMKALSEEELENVSGGLAYSHYGRTIDEKGKVLPETRAQQKHETSSEQLAVVIK